MLPSENIELAIFRFIESAGKGQWRSTSIGTLHTAVGNYDLAELVDALLRLQAKSHIELRKWVETQFLEYPHPALDPSRFFYQQDFQILVTPKGRPYFEQLESRNSLEGQTAKNRASVKPDEVKRESDGIPTAFISYSWETEEHKKWVLRLAERLRSHGVKVILDHWHLKIGGDRTHFMETSISSCEFVIIICTPTYTQKANKRHGGVGYEAMIITGELAKNIQQEKFIPVLRSGEFDDSGVPVWLQTKIGVDLRGDPFDAQQYHHLLMGLHKAQHVAPPVGPKPVFSTVASLREGLPNVGGPPHDQHSGKATAPPRKVPRPKTTVAEDKQVKRKESDPANQLLRRDPVPAGVTVSTIEPEHTGDSIPDNFLLGARNTWSALLEESWPEIGWPLLCARDTQVSLKDIGKIFEPVQKKSHNSGIASPFCRPSSEIASPAEVLKNRRRFGGICADIDRAQEEYDEAQRLCQEADAALKMSKPAHKESIEPLVAKRRQRMTEVKENLGKLKDLRDSVDMVVRNQEAYVFRFQLRDFLVSAGSAINPHTLANALAGLPTMAWRDSLGRCTNMAFDPPRLEYSVWELISEVWRHRPGDFEVAPVEFFKDGVLKLGNECGHPRQFLWNKWWDLRNAIGECWRTPSPRPAGSIPFALTSIFMRHVNQHKDPAERILAATEKLVPSEGRTAPAEP